MKCHVPGANVKGENKTDLILLACTVNPLNEK